MRGRGRDRVREGEGGRKEGERERIKLKNAYKISNVARFMLKPFATHPKSFAHFLQIF